MKKTYLLVVALLAALFYVWLRPPIAAPTSVINEKEVKEAGTYEECVKDGNPVQESYPPSCRTKSGKLITQNVGNEALLKDKIRIESPRPTEKIVSPLKIKGEARGVWFFEAQFGAKLLNRDGEVIGEGIMTATVEWMTDEFVPYSGEIVFNSPKKGSGKLILEKSNPSGLPEKDGQLIVPVTFR